MKKFQKIPGLFYMSLVALTLVCTLASCDKDDDDKKLKLSSSSVTVEVEKTSDITVSGGTAPYTAKSSDDKIASVTVSQSKITVKGVKAGNATITVADKKKNSGKISVTVK